MLPITQTDKITKNNFRIELFDLYRLILKERREPLLSYEEFLKYKKLETLDESFSEETRRKHDKKNQLDYKTYKKVRARGIYKDNEHYKIILPRI